MGSVVTEGDVVRVLGPVIEVRLLGKLVDHEEQDGAKDDTLVQGVANQI